MTSNTLLKFLISESMTFQNYLVLSYSTQPTLGVFITELTELPGTSMKAIQII